MHTPGFLTDRYELTMLSSFVADGSADRRAVFEAFARRLPEGRRYGMLAGLGRLLPLIEEFRFDPDEVAWLASVGAVTPECAAYLADFRFTGDVLGLREGDLYFPGTPVLTVEATLGEAVVLETLVLSVLNHDSAVASAAARMVAAAGGRPLIEMGSRRVHEEAAVAAARAAYVAGFGSTSNLAAGFRYGVPTVGTAAHAFTLAHATAASDGELAAFRSQVASHGPGTSLLVDTYDVAQGIRNAVTAAQEVGASGPGAIRIDSGDLAEESRRARALLDELGAHDTRITVTSDLDEYVLQALADAPIDGYGVGTRLATGSGHPTAGMVYKLVAIEQPDGSMRPVAKRASGKASVGGRKEVWRAYDTTGRLLEETHAVDNATVAARHPEAARLRLAQVPLIDRGVVVHDPPLTAVREHAAHALSELPAEALEVSDGSPALVPEAVVAQPAAHVLQEA